MTDSINSIPTPAFIVNEALAMRNIAAFQEHCDRKGLSLRPHIKTHKSIRFAKAQLAAGAIGITCQKISEAEAMIAEGINDILITYNIIGRDKLERLRALSERVQSLSVVADNSIVVAGLADAFRDAVRPLSVLVECDTGAGRCGVQTSQAAVGLAEEIASNAGLTFGGLMTYPANEGAQQAVDFLRKTKKMLDERGLACPVISSGGSPDMWTAETAGVVTEYRIGTYIYNDRSLVERNTCSWDDCAGKVLATVVSTPTPTRAIVDAGSKALTSDLLGCDGYGHVLGYPKIRIVELSEEHGTLTVDPTNPLKIGDRVKIIPNHVCVVTNLYDQIWIEDANGRYTRLTVDARGTVI
ncbi:MAG: D-TA family PLP-dependent enzyme [Hyphomicrobiales bacterium]